MESIDYEPIAAAIIYRPGVDCTKPQYLYLHKGQLVLQRQTKTPGDFVLVCKITSDELKHGLTHDQWRKIGNRIKVICKELDLCLE